MSQFKKKVISNIPSSSKFIVLMLALLFAIFVVGAAAQEATPTATEPDFEIVTIEVGPLSTTAEATIFVSKDTFISSKFPNSNYGGFSEIRVGRDASYDAVRLLMQFDLTPIPANALINNATLNFYQSGFTPSNDAPYTMQTRYLASDWSEYSVTWNNNQPEWGDPIGTNDIPIGVGWRFANVNTVIQEWVNGRPNYGFMLQGSNEASPRSRNFATRETANRPFITVNYTVDTCAPSSWVNDLPAWSPNGFTVSWDGSDCGSPASGVRDYNVQYSLDNVNWVTWKTNTTDKSSTFNGNHNQVYFFRVQATDNANNVGSWSASKGTTIDSQAPINPTIMADTILSSGYAFPNFLVNWSATDSNSGLNKYEVQYNDNQGGEWIGADFPPSSTSGNFPGGTVGYTYSLQVRATDNVGNVGAWSPSINVIVVNDPSSVVLPLADAPITTNTSFQVTWQGFSTHQINNYTIYYRVLPSATWVSWDTYAANITFATFDVTTEIAGYANETIIIQFQAIATANNSAPEPLQPDRVEASIVVDPNDNMSSNTVFMPLTFKD